VKTYDIIPLSFFPPVLVSSFLPHASHRITPLKSSYELDWCKNLIFGSFLTCFSKVGLCDILPVCVSVYSLYQSLISHISPYILPPIEKPAKIQWGIVFYLHLSKSFHFLLSLSACSSFPTVSVKKTTNWVIPVSFRWHTSEQKHYGVRTT
jgi:hypothetical protein